MTQADVYYTTQEVADLARVHTSTVRRWATRHRIGFVKTPGGHYRFDKAAVEAALGRAS